MVGFSIRFDEAWSWSHICLYSACEMCVVIDKLSLKISQLHNPCVITSFVMARIIMCHPNFPSASFRTHTNLLVSDQCCINPYYKPLVQLSYICICSNEHVWWKLCQSILYVTQTFNFSRMAARQVTRFLVVLDNMFRVNKIPEWPPWHQFD